MKEHKVRHTVDRRNSQAERVIQEQQSHLGTLAEHEHLDIICWQPQHLEPVRDIRRNGEVPWLVRADIEKRAGDDGVVEESNGLCW